MKVEIHLLEQAFPIVRKAVVNSYTKGPLYCILLGSGVIEKYPLCNIFRIKEES